MVDVMINYLLIRKWTRKANKIDLYPLRLLHHTVLTYKIYEVAWNTVCWVSCLSTVMKFVQRTWQFIVSNCNSINFVQLKNILLQCVLVRLIRLGADVNQRHDLGWTALHVAAVNRNNEWVYILTQFVAILMLSYKYYQVWIIEYPIHPVKLCN